MAELTRSLTLLVHGQSKVGKALALDTPILTDTRGWAQMGDLKEGDYVFGADGRPTRIIATSDVMDDRVVYRVTTKSGAELVADAEHQWVVSDKNGRTTVRTTEQILASMNRAGRATHRVPVCEAVQFTDGLLPDELPVHPYILGVWLGDGRARGNEWGCESGDFDEMVKHLGDAEAQIGGVYRHASKDAIYTSFRGITSTFRDLGLLNNKHVPQMYLMASEQARYELLRGLLDSDGTVGAASGSGTTQVSIVQKRSRLSSDIVTLVRSLGIKASVRDFRKPKGYIRVSWTHSKADSPVFKLERKHAALMGRDVKTGATKFDLITAIERVDSAPVRCIQVAASDGAFLAGEMLTVTHNSTLASTAPAPRLFLDIEHGAKFLNITPVMWDPAREEPPTADGTWDTAIVAVRSYDDVLRAHQWLQSGKHPFKSVIVDSVSELQAKVLEQIAGREQVKMQQWGEILRHMAGMMRDLRDLTAHPTNPLTSVIVTSMSKVGNDGKASPYLQGQAGIILPYIFDLTGYLTIEEFPHPDPSQPPYKARRMYIVATPEAVAGERVGGRLGEIVEQEMLDIRKMIDAIFGPESTTTTTTTTSTKEK